jgi:formylglycine-generating enzyme required for sulfatase activity
MQGKFCVTEAFVSVLYFQIFQIVKQFNKTPVTNAEYWRFVQETGQDTPRYSWPNGEPTEDILNLPVESITWFDAVAYAEWAGKQLPTEEQWAKAA